MIYLDYMATTPVDSRVAEKMLRCLTLDGDFGNPSSDTHAFGWRAKALVGEAASQVADLLGASANEIVWTSGATEANNLAIKGAAHFHQHKGKHIVTCKTEHKAVLDCCHELEKQGFEVTYLDVDSMGLVSLDAFESALRPDTILASIMLVNNETGVIQDIARMATTTRERGILFHTDAVQAAGKVHINLRELPVDLLSVSAHKVYGPKGVGALYVGRQPRVRIKSQIHGGGQQGGLRSGTLPTHQIVGMGAAFSLARDEFEYNQQHIQSLSQRLWQGLSEIEAVSLNGDAVARIANNLNICFHGVDAESLMMELSDLAVSAGSACNAVITEASFVLRAMGLSRRDALSSVRFAIGNFTTKAEIDEAIVQVTQAVAKLRAISPLWRRRGRS